MKPLFAALLLVVGAAECEPTGAHPFSAKTVCAIQGVTYHLEAGDDCAAIEQQTALALRILEKHGIKTSVVGLNIWIFVSQKLDAAWYAPFTEPQGRYFPKTRTIHLGGCVKTLAHELLHDFERSRLAASPDDMLSHANWKRAINGVGDPARHPFVDADNEFSNLVKCQ